MTHAETLKQAIRKAIDGGWYGIYKDGHTWPEAKNLLEWQWEEGTETLTDGIGETTISVEAILFSHKFAKALWGELDNENANWPCYPAHRAYEDSESIPFWQYHLQQMVIAEDPIAYLAEHMPA